MGLYHLTHPMNTHEPKGLVKKARCLTRPARARQDVLFLEQGRSMAYRVPEGATAVGARNVHGVREHDKGPRMPLADFFNSPLLYFSTASSLTLGNPDSQRCGTPSFGG